MEFHNLSPGKWATSRIANICELGQRELSIVYIGEPCWQETDILPSEGEGNLLDLAVFPTHLTNRWRQQGFNKTMWVLVTDVQLIRMGPWFSVF